MGSLRRWVVTAFAVVVGLLVTTGCTHEPPDGPGPIPSYDGDAHLHQQAVDALARWDAAVKSHHPPVFLPVGPAFTQVGDWEPAAQGNAVALDAGLIGADDLLPDYPSTTATVRLANGTTEVLPALSAAVALPQTMPTGCSDCEALRITRAELATGVVPTTRGPVIAPLWVYSLAGTSVKLTRPAVAAPPVPVTPPPWESAHPPAGLPYASAITSVDSRAVTVRFTGARAGADTMCGIDYLPEAIESASAVVIVLHEHRPAEPAAANQGCPAIGYPRTATVLLSKPLGERTVLDEVQGLPVSTTRLD